VEGPYSEYLCDERLKTKDEGSQDTHPSYIKLRVLHVSYTGAGVKDTKITNNFLRVTGMLFIING
jgi:hypothetical protein